MGSIQLVVEKIGVVNMRNDDKSRASGGGRLVFFFHRARRNRDKRSSTAHANTSRAVHLPNSQTERTTFYEPTDASARCCNTTSKERLVESILCDGAGIFDTAGVQLHRTKTGTIQNF